MENIKEGLKLSLNSLRETASNEYNSIVPIIEDETSIQTFASPILENPSIMNEFINSLVNRIAYTKFFTKRRFSNKLKFLEGDEMPLGYSGQEIYVNPTVGTKFDIDDFSGLLKKYESDVKVQYTNINVDIQHKVSLSRRSLKKAFVSWNCFEELINSLVDSLYNGVSIDEYEYTKQLIVSAYKNNAVNVQTIETPNTKELAEKFLVQARRLYLDFQEPTTEFNAWEKVGGYGRPVKIWTEPDDIVIILRNDISSEIDVKALAQIFNLDSAKLMGRVINVKSFDVFNPKTGAKIYDGSKIFGMICDRRWFRINQQDMYLDEFYNPNNAIFTYWLNLIKQFNYSVFANAVVFATEQPTGIPTQNITIENTTINKGETIIPMNITPANTTDIPTVKLADANKNDGTVTISGRNLIVNINENFSGTTFSFIIYYNGTTGQSKPINLTVNQNTVSSIISNDLPLENTSPKISKQTK